MNSFMTNYTYYTTNYEYEFVSTPGGDIYPYVSVFFNLDNKVSTLYRENFTLFEAFAATGGLISILKIVFNLIIS